MRLQERFYPESRIRGYTAVDGTIAFYSRVNELVKPESVVLDVGCGVGHYGSDPISFRRDMRVFKGRCRRVIGLDVDAGAVTNPFLDEFRLLNGGSWPVEAGSIDLVLCDWVMEHLNDPVVFFAETARVLRFGGYMCIRTPNLFSYLGVASKLVPNRFHYPVKSNVTGTEGVDAFPTLYRCNSKVKIRAMMLTHGMEPLIYAHEPEPSYLSFSPVAYLVGVLYQRWAPNAIKSVILAFGRRCSV